MRARAAVLVAALVTPACSDPHPLAPDRAAMAGAQREVPAGETPGVTALTWNVYVGAEIERVVQAQTPEQAVALATEEWANVRATNFPARAGVLAAAIAARRPQVVGLEELALYRTTERPFDELATQVAYDFLALVLDSLHAQGVDYIAAAVDRTTDIQVPVIAGANAAGEPVLAGVRFTDGDAVLLRGDVPYANPQSGVYTAFTPVTIGPVTTGEFQGWSAVDATLGQRTYRIVATHLAGQEALDVQLAQTRELLAVLAAQSQPTLLLGDFNSDAFGADPTRATPTYGMVRGAGFGDAWSEPDRAAPGLTCCERADLLNRRPSFDQRIDFVFSRNLGAGLRPLHRAVLGDSRGERTAAGLWPSDHGGVVVTFGPTP